MADWQGPEGFLNISYSIETAFSGLSLIVRRPLSVVTISLLNLIAVGLLSLPNFWILSYPASGTLIMRASQIQAFSGQAPVVRPSDTSGFITAAQSRIQAIEQLRDQKRQYYASNIAKWEQRFKDLPAEYAAPGAPERYGPDRHLTGSDIQGVIADFKRQQAMDEENYREDLSRDAEIIRSQQGLARQEVQEEWSQSRGLAYAADQRGVTTIVKRLPAVGLILLFVVQVIAFSAIFRDEEGEADRNRLLLRVGRKELRVAMSMGRLVLLYPALVMMSIVVMMLIIIGGAMLTWGHPGAEGWELVAILAGPVSAVVGLVVWVLLTSRFGACLPMAFYDGKGSLRRAWTLTKSTFLETFVSNGLIVAQLIWLALAILAIYHIVFDAPLGAAASAGTPWTPPTPAQALFTCLAVGLALGPATAIVAAPMARFYRAAAVGEVS